MIFIEGKYGKAKVFTDNIEESAKSRVEELLDQEFVEGSKIRIMPDCHDGKGCVIGFTANLGGKVVPNIVGVDVGCGMITVELGDIGIDLGALDEIIRENIPSGFNIHDKAVVRFRRTQDLKCYRKLRNKSRINRSIGTLGGGNHFIEVGEDSEGSKFLVIHSGSRNLGNQVARIYQEEAVRYCNNDKEYYDKRNKIVTIYKKQGKERQIQEALEELKVRFKKKYNKYPRELCYLEGDARERYLHDMRICQEYARLNREVMTRLIIGKLIGKNLEDFKYFHTTHNYIDFRDNIIRKGSISAYEGEELLIPINMRDGSILGVGKGNSDWNYSAPHGAGRLMSRNKAREVVSIEEFRESMKGVYTTSVNRNTLDESPMAYKPMEEILEKIEDTVEVRDIIRPLYNFKDS